MIALNDLLKEPICNSDNHARVLHNHVQRQRISEFMKTPEGKKSVLVGSSVHSGFSDEARLGFDVDIIIPHGVDWGGYRRTVGDIWSRARFDEVEVHSDRDITFPEIKELVLPKRISVDESVTVRTPIIEWHLATALCRLYSKVSKGDYRSKLSYDIWALAQAEGIDTGRVQEILEHLMHDQDEYFRVKQITVLRGIRDYTEEAVSLKWEKGKFEYPATSTATPQKVFATVNQVTSEFDFKKD
ncbi:MAG: hypothetical protein FWE31_01980 [Firmicutes bacterium]|nr:hypothetical protein [Bacillota bacterium]